MKQGCLLFSIFLGDLEGSLNGGVSVGNKDIKRLMYADDIVLFASLPRNMKNMITKLGDYCRTGTWNLVDNI